METHFSTSSHFFSDFPCCQWTIVEQDCQNCFVVFRLFSLEDAYDLSIAFRHVLNRHIAILPYQSYIFTQRLSFALGGISLTKVDQAGEVDSIRGTSQLRGSSASGSVGIRSFQPTTCMVGAWCSHAILTVKIGVYRCPFGSCFKRRSVT